MEASPVLLHHDARYHILERLIHRHEPLEDLLDHVVGLAVDFVRVVLETTQLRVDGLCGVE